MPIITRTLSDFFRLEAAGGLCLIVAAFLALVAANSPAAEWYDALLAMPVSFGFGTASLSKPFLLWVNDGLMAVFFFLVGMEIKRELLAGELSGRGQAVLPAIAACGGVMLPALIYMACNAGNAETQAGWAIPCATDIAFSLCVLSLLGSRVPVGMKVFLTAVAVIDDLIAILIIAFFYTGALNLNMLLLAVVCLSALVLLGRFRVMKLSPYILPGLALWFFVLKSGVHATIAGVALGLCIPLAPARAGGKSLLKTMEKHLHPWVAFGILPLFAFTNAGLSLDGLSPRMLTDPVPLGIAAGLFAGKQFGIFAAAFLVIRSGFAKLPSGMNWPLLYGVSIVAGIGFTMSLFIGSLSFTDHTLLSEMRMGVLAGSFLSAIAGYVLLAALLPHRSGKQ